MPTQNGRQPSNPLPTQKQKPTVGRPSLYKPEFCQSLVDHMAKGLSFESFAGLVGVTRDTVYEWANKHPEFSDARSLGRAKQFLFYEKLGIAGAAGLQKPFSFPTYQWLCRVMLGIKDGTENAAQFHQHVYDPKTLEYLAKSALEQHLPKPAEVITITSGEPDIGLLKEAARLEENKEISHDKERPAEASPSISAGH